jgi:hypothetical protein
MPEKKSPTDQVSEILVALGDTPDQVAGTLRANGCRGYRIGNFPSPLQRYLYRHFDGGAILLIHSVSDMAPDCIQLCLAKGGSAPIPLPSAVKGFLAAFGKGKYPDLELNQKG